MPTIVYGTREDKLPYMKLFHRGVDQLDLRDLVERANEPDPNWVDDGRLLTALLGPDRTEAALATGAALAGGASLEDVLDVVTLAVSERMLRYDTDGELDFHDDFGWLDITHGMTYANAARWHVGDGPVTVDDVRLVLWTAFLANWTGRHEWHTAVGERAEIEPRSNDLLEYGRSLQHEALLDGTTAFIVHGPRRQDERGGNRGSDPVGNVRAARCHRPLHGRPEARTLRRRHRDPQHRLPQRQSPPRLTGRRQSGQVSEAIGSGVGGDGEERAVTGRSPDPGSVREPEGASRWVDHRIPGQVTAGNASPRGRVVTSGT